MSARIVHLREAGSKRNATSEAKGRGKNEAYRTREHLTEAEMDKLLAALKRNRHGHRDWLIGLLIFRHGLRVSEACNLCWDDIDLKKRTISPRPHLWRCTDKVANGDSDLFGVRLDSRRHFPTSWRSEQRTSVGAVLPVDQRTAAVF
jgi:integrase